VDQAALRRAVARLKLGDQFLRAVLFQVRVVLFQVFPAGAVLEVFRVFLAAGLLVVLFQALVVLLGALARQVLLRAAGLGVADVLRAAGVVDLAVLFAKVFLFEEGLVTQVRVLAFQVLVADFHVRAAVAPLRALGAVLVLLERLAVLVLLQRVAGLRVAGLAALVVEVLRPEGLRVVFLRAVRVVVVLRRLLKVLVGIEIDSWCGRRAVPCPGLLFSGSPGQFSDERPAASRSPHCAAGVSRAPFRSTKTQGRISRAPKKSNIFVRVRSGVRVRSAPSGSLLRCASGTSRQEGRPALPPPKREFRLRAPPGPAGMTRPAGAAGALK
jgi:hypothetical protein